MNKELAKTLTTAIVRFIDKERPEETMCCSNAECENIEQMLEGEHFDIVETFIQKKLSRLTEFEQALSNFLKNDFEYFHTKKWDGQKWNDVIMVQSKELLALAKKQLLSYADESNPAIEAMADLERTFKSNPEKLPKWLKDEIERIELEAHARGYNQGYKTAKEAYNKSGAYPYNTRPLCWDPGGICTIPQMDCINCPKKTTGGGWTSILECNTSVTDGKPHNPSFTE